jgi:hypothetical protein
MMAVFSQMVRGLSSTMLCTGSWEEETPRLVDCAACSFTTSLSSAGPVRTMSWPPLRKITARILLTRRDSASRKPRCVAP